MRVWLLVGVVVLLSLYAWRDWYRSLCGLVVLLAVIEHPDLPRTLLGVPGLNLWNLLLVAVLAAWAVSRRREGLEWDMPGFATVLLGAYAAVVLTSTFRMLADPAALGHSTGELVNDHLLNTLKWVIPGLLLYDGCRSRDRFVIGVASIVAVHVLLAVQIARWIPPSYVLDSAALEHRAREVLNDDIGLYRTDLAMMMAGGAWAALASRFTFRRWWLRLAATGGAVLTSWALLLTAGRAGYISWVAVALCFSFLRWRRYLLLVPVALALVLSLAPAAVERMLEGMGEDQIAMHGDVDRDAVTAGRTNIWPYVVKEIGKAPIGGHGREAMIRTGLTDFGRHAPDVREAFGHPHSLYLETLLDTGVVGFVCVMGFYLVSLLVALRLLVDKRSGVFVAAGGTAGALLLAFLVSGIGGRHLYPEEVTAPMWASLGLLLRVFVQRRMVGRAAPALVPAEDPASMPARGRWSSRLAPGRPGGDTLDERLWAREGTTSS